MPVDAVKLHRELEVRAWQEKLGEAQEQLGGFSSGIGVLGSPGVAIASAAAIGILEAAVSSSKEKKGLRLLAEAQQMLDELRNGGEFIPVSKIAGIEHPVPSTWCVMEQGEVTTDLSAYGMFEKQKIIDKHKVTFGEQMAGFFKREGMVRGLVVLPDEFLWVRGNDGPTALRWTSIEWFRASKEA